MARSLLARLAYRFDPAVRARVDSYARRDVLRLIAVGAAGLTLSGTLGLRSASGAWLLPRVRRDAPSVVIVGAGFAGLACAYEMRAAGCPVNVIDARGRVGGRVVTLGDLVPGAVVEGGGEFIGANHPRWIAYAQRFNLTLTPVSEGDEALHAPVMLGGKTLTFDEVEHLYGEMAAAMGALTEPAAAIDADAPWTSPDAASLDGMSLEDWLGELNIAERTAQAVRAQMAADNGVDLARCSLLGLLACIKGHGLARYWTDTETHRCQGGNHRLAAALADAVGHEHITLSRAVKRIEVKDDGAAVVLRDGARVTADEVVLAVPPSVWGNIEIDPPLPEALTPQMGSALKHFTHVKKRHWVDDKLAPDAMSDGDLTFIWDGTDGQPAQQACQNGFAGGPGARRLSAMSASDRAAACDRQLDALYPGASANRLSSRLMVWPKDPLTLGGYSFPAPGQVTAHGPVMAAPLGPGVGRLHLAGEHTCYAFVGYMEGALASGGKVAQRIAARAGVAAPKPGA